MLGLARVWGGRGATKLELPRPSHTITHTAPQQATTAMAWLRNNARGNSGNKYKTTRASGGGRPPDTVSQHQSRTPNHEVLKLSWGLCCDEGEERATDESPGLYTTNAPTHEALVSASACQHSLWRRAALKT